MKRFLLVVATVMLVVPSTFAGTINGTKIVSSGTATMTELSLQVENEPQTIYRFNIAREAWSAPGLALPMLVVLTTNKSADIKCLNFLTGVDRNGITINECTDAVASAISMTATP